MNVKLPPIPPLPDSDRLHASLNALVLAAWLFRCSFDELARDPTSLEQIIGETASELNTAEDIIVEWAELLEIRAVALRR